jgi:hypothetical protein
MPNPDKRSSLLNQLVSAARAVNTYQVGLPLGCIRLGRIKRWLEPYEPIDLPMVDQYLKAVRALPIGTERLGWDRAALRAKDVELEAVNRRFRDPVFEACYDIISRYAGPPSADPVV